MRWADPEDQDKLDLDMREWKWLAERSAALACANAGADGNENDGSFPADRESEGEETKGHGEREARKGAAVVIRNAAVQRTIMSQRQHRLSLLRMTLQVNDVSLRHLLTAPGGVGIFK